jgi:hypothetical protein
VEKVNRMDRTDDDLIVISEEDVVPDRADPAEDSRDQALGLSGESLAPPRARWFDPGQHGTDEPEAGEPEADRPDADEFDADEPEAADEEPEEADEESVISGPIALGSVTPAEGTPVPESSVPESSVPESSGQETSGPETSGPETSALETSALETSAEEAPDPGASAPAAPQAAGTALAAPSNGVSGNGMPGTSVSGDSVSDDSSWPQIQSLFVDDPHSAVRQAADVAGGAVAALTAAARNREESLRDSWQADSTGTEELRVALREYRELAGRLSALAQEL